VEDRGNYTTPKDQSLTQLSIKLAEFCNVVRKISQTGLHNLDDAILKKIIGEGTEMQFSDIKLHLPSSRILKAALKQSYYLYQNVSCDLTQAQIYAAHIVINQAAYGKFGTQKIGKNTTRELLYSLASTKGLLPMAKQRRF